MTRKRWGILFFFFPLTLFFLCLAFPRPTVEGVGAGLDVLLFSALPALFPALVLSRMMVLLSGSLPLSLRRALPLFFGIIGGFPVGASVVCHMVQQGVFSKKQGEKMLFFCNNPGPAFLIHFCGVTLFGSVAIGWVFFVLQTLLILFFYCVLMRREKPVGIAAPKTLPSLTSVLPRALSDSASSFLYIASCILFFTFLSHLISSLFRLSPLWESVIALFLELSGGVKRLFSLPLSLALPLCGAGVGWSGVSVHLQTLGILQKAGLSSRLYFCGKVTFALLMALGMTFFQKLL